MTTAPLHRLGLTNPSVPVETVLPHLEALRAAGMTYARIAKLAGISPRTVQVLAARSAPSAQPVLLTSVARCLLAVSPQHGPSGTRHVSSASTVRRLQALVVQGYTLAHLGRLLGLSRGALDAAMRHDMIRLSRAVEIRRLYQRLAFAAPTYRGGNAAGAATRASAVANRNGWRGPLDWEDIEAGVPATWQQEGSTDSDEGDPDPTTLVDEVAIDQFLAGADVSLTGAERVACASRLLAAGHSRNHIAERLHMNWRKLNEILAVEERGLGPETDAGPEAPGAPGRAFAPIADITPARATEVAA